MLIISDVDEIPSTNKLKFLKSSDFKKIAPVALEQHLFHIDCNFLRLQSWRGSIVTNIEICNTYSPHQLRRKRNRISHLTDSGWSFSSFGGPKKVREKLESIAHTEYNNDEFKNEKHIINCQKTGADLFKKNVKTKKVEKSAFPNDLLKLMEENPIFYFGSNN
tara:strand:- start:305 stop:793 length:489 start_codon:yes stop_codon:yes gene_type:complete